MAETALEKATCVFCGAVAREDTAFCYNCGKPIDSERDGILNGASKNGSLPEETPIQKPGSDLTKDLETVSEGEQLSSQDPLAVAAAKRKRARLSQRKPKQVVWISTEESSNLVYILVTLLITAIAAGVVLIAVYLK
jgi:hypothetical protein